MCVLYSCVSHTRDEAIDICQYSRSLPRARPGEGPLREGRSKKKKKANRRVFLFGNPQHELMNVLAISPPFTPLAPLSILPIITSDNLPPVCCCRRYDDACSSVRVHFLLLLLLPEAPAALSLISASLSRSSLQRERERERERERGNKWKGRFISLSLSPCRERENRTERVCECARESYRERGNNYCLPLEMKRRCRT